MTRIKSILRRTALTLPPIRQLHTDYHGALVDYQSITLENRRLEAEIEKLQEVEPAVKLIDRTHEAERDRYIKLLEGLQYTADQLTEESTRQQATIEQLTEELNAVRQVAAAISSENAQLKNHTIRMEDELKTLDQTAEQAQQDEASLRQELAATTMALTKAEAREVELTQRASQTEAFQATLNALTQTTSSGHESLKVSFNERMTDVATHLDNLTATTDANLLELSGSLKTYIDGLQSVLESTGLMQRTQLQQILNSVAGANTSATADNVNLQASSVVTAQWLDLMEAVLTGTITKDAPMSPWSEGKFDPAVRIIGRDWPESAYTMIGTARMRNLRALTESVIADAIPGDLLEAGTWRGGACIYMKAILRAYAQEHRRVFVADSFCGLPEPDAENYPADEGDEHHVWEELAASKQDVMDNFKTFNLLDESVVFLEGWFKDTLADAPVEQLAILRLDGDMYESTMDTLSALFHKVAKGGYVIVDDYLLPPCKKAVDEFRDAKGITDTLHEVDGAAVYWRVS